MEHPHTVSIIVITTPIICSPVPVHMDVLTALDVSPLQWILDVVVVVCVVVVGDFFLALSIFDTALSARLVTVLRAMNLDSSGSNFSQVGLSTRLLNMLSSNLRRDHHLICSPSSGLSNFSRMYSQKTGSGAE